MGTRTFAVRRRVVIFRELVVKDKVEVGIAVTPGVHVMPVVDIRVRRDRLVEDGFALLASLGPKLKVRRLPALLKPFTCAQRGLLKAQGMGPWGGVQAEGR